jgi:hypothetical protein
MKTNGIHLPVSAVPPSNAGLDALFVSWFVIKSFFEVL